jgi:signal transduction histidine kinase
MRLVLNYSFSLLTVAIILIIRHALHPLLGLDAPLLLFLLAVMASAWVGGVGPGILATILGLGAGIYFFIEPDHTIEVLRTPDQVRAILYLVEGVSFSMAMGLTSMALERERATTRKIELTLLELAAATAEAENANRSKSFFLANITHEIRTPLNAILGFNDLLRFPDVTESERLQYLEIINRNSKYLSKLIDDFLDMSRMESGELELEYTKTSITEILSDVIELLTIKIQDKGIKLNAYNRPYFPAFVRTDPTRLRQILINLIGNAIKFTDKGAVTVTFSWIKEVGGIAQFLVHDSGCGIAPEQRRHLFQPFSQGGGTTFRKYGGTGLGLYLSQKLARELGGDIQLVASEVGHGSTFLVSVAAPPMESPNIVIDTEIQRQQMDFHGLKVLVVDDIPDNQILIGRILKQMNCTVSYASNGLEGVQRALSGDCQIILMDLQMPVLDGIEATKQLRDRHCNLPIIAVTALTSEDMRTRAIAAGFNSFLTKPFSVNVLYSAIHQEFNLR